jgi:hypothetical protein
MISPENDKSVKSCIFISGMSIDRQVVSRAAQASLHMYDVHSGASCQRRGLQRSVH